MKKYRKLVGLFALMFTPGLSVADWNEKRHGYHEHKWGGGSQKRYQYERHDSWDDRYWDNYRKPMSSGNSFWYGVKSGRLSDREVRDLREAQWELRQKEREYWSDGSLSRREQEDLWDSYRDYRKELNHNLNDGEWRPKYRYRLPRF
jgi:hypothetical protein